MGGSEGRRWLVNATMMNVHMVNEIEGYLQLGRQNADNLGLTASIGWSEYALTVTFSVLKVQVLKISISKMPQQVLNYLSQSPQVKFHFLQTIHFFPQIIFFNFTFAGV